LGNTSTYTLSNGAQVSLPAGPNFSTKLGSDGGTTSYTVITSLGAAGSTTATDLQGMAGNLAGKYVLGADINASPTSGWNSNGSGGFYGFAPVGDNSSNTVATRFTGVFDGLGHTIAGLTINRPSTGYYGLFGYTDGATVRNVGMMGGSVSGIGEIGGLVGKNNGTIANAYATGSVSAGSNSNGGGLVGQNNGTIANAYATGSVSVSGFDSSGGGLVGANFGTIANAYATGSVSASGLGVSSGGLVGANFFTGTITNAYSTGAVTNNGGGASFAGGLVAANVGTVTNSYWDTQTSGQGGSDGGSGLTTAQAMTQASFTGFDFTNTWWMADSNTRPFLRSEYSTTVTNAHQLQLMAMDLTASYTLANNIDASETSAGTGMWGSAGFAPVGSNSSNSNATRFTGSFDGLGHTISGLTINRASTDYVGLFGYANGTLRNVGLPNSSIKGHQYVGTLAGLSGAAISNSYATGAVVGSSIMVGGLVGKNGGNISNSYATSSVSGTDTVGGLVGFQASNSIANSYATGDVNGNTAVGGLVGALSSTVSNSYATGHVNGSSIVGGLIGTSSGGTVTDSFWNTQTGYPTNNSSGATGKTTAQMKQLATFAGWDIDDAGGTGKIWRIYEGNTNPLLRSFLTPLAVTANAAGKTYDGLAYSGGNGVSYSIAPNANLLGAATYGGSSQGAVNVGSYVITPSGLYSNQQGYDITYANGNLTVNTAPLTVTANGFSKIYDGLAYSGGNGVGYSGFVNSEGSGVLGGALAYGGNAQGAVNAGSYVITPSGLTSSNYAITYASGSLSITPAALPYIAPVSQLVQNSITATAPTLKDLRLVENTVAQLESTILLPSANNQPETSGLVAENSSSEASSPASANNAVQNNTKLSSTMTIGKNGPTFKIMHPGVKLPDYMVNVYE
jgi:hypothetical protein